MIKKTFSIYSFNTENELTHETKKWAYIKKTPIKLN